MKTIRAFKEIIISNVGKLNKEDILSERINNWMRSMEEEHFDIDIIQYKYQITETRHSVLIFYRYFDLEENEKAIINNDSAYVTNYITNKEPIEPSCEIKITNGLDPETGEWGHNA